MNIVDKIYLLHPAARFGVDFTVVEHEDHSLEIVQWDADKLGPEPSEAQLDAVTPPLAPLQAALCADIDKQAQAQRDLYVTPGGAQSATYLLKQTQAVNALAAQATTDAGKTAAQLATAYPYLANEIGITADPTTSAAATDIYGVARAIVAVLNAWQPLNLSIEAMRLKTKAAINAATTAAAAQAVHDAAAWPKAS